MGVGCPGGLQQAALGGPLQNRAAIWPGSCPRPCPAAAAELTALVPGPCVLTSTAAAGGDRAGNRPLWGQGSSFCQEHLAKGPCGRPGSGQSQAWAVALSASSGAGVGHCSCAECRATCASDLCRSAGELPGCSCSPGSSTFQTAQPRKRPGGSRSRFAGAPELGSLYAAGAGRHLEERVTPVPSGRHGTPATRPACTCLPESSPDAELNSDPE